MASAQKYSRLELQNLRDDAWPDRGEYCQKCTNIVPSFEDISDEDIEDLRALIAAGNVMSAMQRSTTRQVAHCVGPRFGRITRTAGTPYLRDPRHRARIVVLSCGPPQRSSALFAMAAGMKKSSLPQGDAQQSLAADGATACFSSSLVPFSSDADRAPQLKAIVGWLRIERGVISHGMVDSAASLFCVHAVFLSNGFCV
jgi:hypothetical protein